MRFLNTLQKYFFVALIALSLFNSHILMAEVSSDDIRSNESIDDLDALNMKTQFSSSSNTSTGDEKVDDSFDFSQFRQQILEKIQSYSFADQMNDNMEEISQEFKLLTSNNDLGLLAQIHLLKYFRFRLNMAQKSNLGYAVVAAADIGFLFVWTQIWSELRKTHISYRLSKNLPNGSTLNYLQELSDKKILGQMEYLNIKSKMNFNLFSQKLKFYLPNISSSDRITNPIVEKEFVTRSLLGKTTVVTVKAANFAVLALIGASSFSSLTKSIYLDHKDLDNLVDSISADISELEAQVQIKDLERLEDDKN